MHTPKLERNHMTHTTVTQAPRALRRQQGFGLVELGISLTLIAVLLLGAFYIVSNIRTSTVQKEFTQSSSQVMAAASKYMAKNRSTSAVTTDMLVGTGGGQADKMITHPTNTAQRAIRSAIPGAWEDIGNNFFNLKNGADTNFFAYANESIVYRINKVPKEYCNFVVGELARNPSVAKVSGRVWTANTNSPAGLAGNELAWGPALYNRQNSAVGLGSTSVTSMCANPYTEIFALVVPV